MSDVVESYFPLCICATGSPLFLIHRQAVSLCTLRYAPISSVPHSTLGPVVVSGLERVSLPLLLPIPIVQLHYRYFF